MRSEDKAFDDYDSDLLEPPSNGMSDCIKSLEFPVGRLRTGTPPRLLMETIDFTDLEKQEAD